jgi:hypothetical protein
MEKSRYLVPRPPMDLDPATIAAFEALVTTAVLPGSGAAIDYGLDAPKWQFLCWLCDTHEILLHGSGNPDITEFEPRQSNDIEEFGNRQAVYAASDGIWPLYFAVVDRDNGVTSLVNACVRLIEADGTRHGPYYFFSINADAWERGAWRNGTIYILPRSTFEAQPLMPEQDGFAEVAQWASLVPVRPLARLAVTPDDFPFLAQVRRHDFAVVSERARRNPDGFPWIDE